MHTEHISLIEDIVNSFANGELSAEEALVELENIESRSTYPYWITVLAYGMAGCFRTLMFGGQIIDGLASILCGVCMGIFIQALNSKNTFTFLVNCCGGFVTGFMADQTPSPANIHHWVMFMGMPTPVLTGYETLARKLDAAVVYIDVELLSRGRYKATFKLVDEHPVDTDGFPIADRYMEAMEQTIGKRGFAEK